MATGRWGSKSRRPRSLSNGAFFSLPQRHPECDSLPVRESFTIVRWILRLLLAYKPIPVGFAKVHGVCKTSLIWPAGL